MRSYFKKLLVVLVAAVILVVVLFACYLNTGVDATSPLWRNQSQSRSTVVQGEYVSLQAEGLDAVSLRQAVLSTNETGVWRNETKQQPLWVQETVNGFDNFGTATYKDGIVYAPSKGDSNVYALNASNGDIVWNKTVRECDSSPCVEGDVIYVGECSGPRGELTPFPKAFALNRSTGEVIWSFIEPGNYGWVGSPLVNGDYVYYTTLGSGVYALNKTNGNPVWHREDIGEVVCSVAYNDGVVFVSAYDPPGQFALNASTGENVWHKVYGSSWDSSPVVYNGIVVQVVYNRTTQVWRTLVLNGTSGEVLRTFNKGSTGTPLVYDDKIFVASLLVGNWRLYAYDLVTGEEVWHTIELHNGLFQNQSYCSAVVSGGAIYYQALNGTFYVINVTEGGILWSYVLGGYGFGSISVGDGCVFITNDFALYAFGIGEGSGDWPMFCGNGFHQSFSEGGVECVRFPLVEPRDLGGLSGVWVVARFVWCSRSVFSVSVAWRIYFFDNAGNVNATDVMVFYVNEADSG